jgi:hypothetical protein
MKLVGADASLASYPSKHGFVQNFRVKQIFCELQRIHRDKQEAELRQKQSTPNASEVDCSAFEWLLNHVGNCSDLATCWHRVRV